MVHGLLNAFTFPHCFTFDFSLFDFLSDVLETFGDKLIEFLLPVHLHLLGDHYEGETKNK